MIGLGAVWDCRGAFPQEQGKGASPGQRDVLKPAQARYSDGKWSCQDSRPAGWLPGNTHYGKTGSCHMTLCIHFNLQEILREFWGYAYEAAASSWSQP